VITYTSGSFSIGSPTCHLMRYERHHHETPTLSNPVVANLAGKGDSTQSGPSDARTAIRMMLQVLIDREAGKTESPPTKAPTATIMRRVRSIPSGWTATGPEEFPARYCGERRLNHSHHATAYFQRKDVGHDRQRD